MKKRIISIIAALLLVLSLFVGCSSQLGTAEQGTADASGTTASTVASDVLSDEMFTDRDKEIGYSESESTTITLADGAADINGGGASADGDTVTITDEGTYILSGSLSDGQIVVDAADNAKLQIVLNGVSITNGSSAAIYIKNADKVFITTASGTENTVSVTGEFVQTDDNNIDAAIFAKSDLTLNGAGTLTISSEYGHGVVSKDDLAVTSGTYNITSAKQGLYGKNSVRIADGTFKISAGTDGIHSENTDDTALGFVYIAGGTFSISAEKQGISGTATVSILGGTIDIKKSYEGIEGLAIDISGGDISIVSSDDGLNGAGGNDQSGNGGMAGMAMQTVEGCYINISGGTLTIDASGDGIDSNGTLTISGGNITIYGPTQNGNGALDYNGTGEITGGTLIASSNGGMEESLSDSSTQCSILYGFTSVQEAGTTVTLKDSGGNVIAEFAPEKSFSAVYISVPSLAQGSSYTLTVGSQDYTIEFTSTIYSNGVGGMEGGMGGHMGGDGQLPQDGKGGSGGRGQPPQGAAGNDAVSSATVQQ